MPACHSTEHAGQAILRLQAHGGHGSDESIPCPSLINDQVRRESVVDLLNAGYINRGQAALHLRRYRVHVGCVAHYGNGWYDTAGTSLLPQCLQSCPEQTDQSMRADDCKNRMLCRRFGSFDSLGLNPCYTSSVSDQAALTGRNPVRCTVFPIHAVTLQPHA